jgi:alpha-beta hydrolase superfamily lysophospholipase
MNLTKLLILTILIICCESQNIIGQNSDFELVHFNTEDGGNIEAALFSTDSGKIIIYAHGAVFNKESWYFLAEEFQKQDIAGLSIDFRGYGNSKSGKTNEKYHDILGAINYAKINGYTDINIIGGSMGGAAVLSALDQTDNNIAKVVLMAPASGPGIKSEQINKLFIVSKNEGGVERVIKVYKASADPKKLKEYSGSKHAQHLFNSEQANKVKNLILSFIVKD